MAKRGFLTGVVAGVAALLAVGAVRAARERSVFIDAREDAEAEPEPEPAADTIEQMDAPYYLIPHMRELSEYVGGEDFPDEAWFVLWLASVEYTLWLTVKGSVLDTPNPGLYALWKRGESATDVARALMNFGREGSVSE